MNITLNGEKKDIPDTITVLGLLEFLNIQHQRVAVELNETIVKKDRYAETALKKGDSLEVVSFMGGGRGETTLADGSFHHEGAKYAKGKRIEAGN